MRNSRKSFKIKSHPSVCCDRRIKNKVTVDNTGFVSAVNIFTICHIIYKFQSGYSVKC